MAECSGQRESRNRAERVATFLRTTVRFWVAVVIASSVAAEIVLLFRVTSWITDVGRVGRAAPAASQVLVLGCFILLLLVTLVGLGRVGREG